MRICSWKIYSLPSPWVNKYFYRRTQWLLFFVKSQKRDLNILFNEKIAKKKAFNLKKKSSRSLWALVGLIGGRPCSHHFQTTLRWTCPSTASGNRKTASEGLSSLSPVKITARRVSPRATDIFEDTTEIFGNSIWTRESQSTFAAKSTWWVMKIGGRRGRETPKGEKTSRILQLNPGYALSIPIPSIFYLFLLLSIFFSLATTNSISLWPRCSRIVPLCSLFPSFLLLSSTQPPTTEI